MSMHVRLLAWLCAAGLPIVALAADDNRIVIGQSVALSGPIAEHGSGVAAGARLYLDTVNAAGGIAGRRIELVSLDDGGDAKRAAENTRRLIEQDRVLALFGGVEGGPCVASLKQASERSVPLIACMAGSPEMREPFNRYSFPLRAPHVEEFAKLLDVAKTYGFRRVAFLHADSETGRKHLANVRRLAAARGVEIAPFVLGNEGETVAAALATANVDAVFNHGSYAQYAAAIRAARAKLSQPPLFMAVNSGAAQLAKMLGRDAKGLIFTQVVPFPWAVAVPVVKEYQQALARQPDGPAPSFSSLEGFVSAKLLVAGLRAAGKDPTRERLQRALESLGTIDLGGMTAHYGPATRAGSSFVETVIVAADGRFSR